MADYLSPLETQLCQPGQVVVNVGGDVWRTYNNVSTFYGYQVGICLKTCAPGNPLSVVVEGRVPYDMYNLGAGNAGPVQVGVNPSRWVSGTATILGSCDPSGEIFIRNTYLGEPTHGVVDSLAGIGFANTPTITGQVLVYTAAGQFSFASVATAASVIGTGLWHSTANTLDNTAYIGAADQILVTNHAGNGTSWVSATANTDLTYANSVWTVVGLQGVAIASTAPTSNQILTYNSGTGKWTPTTPGSIGTGAAGAFLVTNSAANASEWKSLQGDAIDSTSTTGRVTVQGLQTTAEATGALALGTSTTGVTMTGTTSTGATPPTQSLIGSTGLAGSAGSAGGPLVFTAGTGGAGSTTTGGAGGALTITSGTGGAGFTVGGASGTLSLLGATGGAATNAGNPGGAGASIVITAGNGGSGGPSNTANQGAGGSVTIDAGAGGNNGISPGTIQIANGNAPTVNVFPNSNLTNNSRQFNVRGGGTWTIPSSAGNGFTLTNGGGNVGGNIAGLTYGITNNFTLGLSTFNAQCGSNATLHTSGGSITLSGDQGITIATNSNSANIALSTAATGGTIGAMSFTTGTATGNGSPGGSYTFVAGGGGPTAGTAGAYGFTSGAGGTHTTGTAANGGAFTANLGAGGNVTTGTGGAGGSFTFTAGAGGSCSGAGTNGTGGSFTVVVGAIGTGGTGGAAGSINLGSSGATPVGINLGQSSTQININATTTAFAATITPIVKHATPASDVATVPLTFTAQAALSTAVTNIDGGYLQLQGGASKANGTTGKRGGIRLQLGGDSGDTMLGVGETFVGQRHVALVQGGTGTSTNDLPANSGDLVVWIGNCNVAPTAAPGNGAVLYASGGALFVYQANGTNFQISPSTAPTWANDLASSSQAHQYVSGISGSSGLGGTVTVGDGVHATTLQGQQATTLTTTSGALTLDSAAGLNLANTTATSLTVGNNSTMGAIAFTSLTSGSFSYTHASTALLSIGQVSGDIIRLGTATAYATLQNTALTFSAAASSPTINQTTRGGTTSNAFNFTIQAQSASSTANTTGTGAQQNGGILLLQGGQAQTAGSAGVRGGVRLQLDAGSGETFLEVGEVSDTNTPYTGPYHRFVALCQNGSGLASANLPANSGDGVVWVGATQSDPTANPTAGALLYTKHGTTSLFAAPAFGVASAGTTAFDVNVTTANTTTIKSALALPMRVISGTITVDTGGPGIGGTDGVIRVNATGLTINLANPTAGRLLVIKDITGNANPNCTVSPGAQTIDGTANSIVIQSAYVSIGLMGDGTNWIRVF